MKKSIRYIKALVECAGKADGPLCHVCLAHGRGTCGGWCKVEVSVTLEDLAEALKAESVCDAIANTQPWKCTLPRGHAGWHVSKGGEIWKGADLKALQAEPVEPGHCGRCVYCGLLIGVRVTAIKGFCLECCQTDDRPLKRSTCGGCGAPFRS